MGTKDCLGGVGHYKREESMFEDCGQSTSLALILIYIDLWLPVYIAH